MQRRFAIILGGGRSARMGRDKRALVLDGRSLLALAVDACADRDLIVTVTPDLPWDVPTGRVTCTLEDPPFGGPAAGIAAGLAALPPALPGDEVLLLACDLPRVADIVAVLDAAPLAELVETESTPASSNDGAGRISVSTSPTDGAPRPAVTPRSTNEAPRTADPAGSFGRLPSTDEEAPDGVCLLDAEEYPQYLAARYRRDALEARLVAVGDPRAQSVRRLMRGLRLRRILAPGITTDVDTPDEAAAAGIS